MGDVKDSPKAKESRAPKRRRKLGEVLLEAGPTSQDQLTKARKEGARSGQRRGEYPVDQAIVSERDIASRLSHQLGYLFVDLTKETLNPVLSVTIPEPLARRYQAVPMKLDGKSLTVAMADPLDFDAIQDISFFSGCTVKPVLAGRSAVKQAAEKIYQKKEVAAAVDRIVADSSEEVSADLLGALAAESQPTESEIQSLEGATRREAIVRLCNMLMTEAVRSRVSDIHVEPTKKDTIVRLRVDGLLRET